MNAGRLLRETGYDSDSLMVMLSPVDPDEINVYPAAWPLRKFWRPGIKGVTHWRWVFVEPDFMRGDRDKLARLVIHELVHVRQYRDAGYVTFTVRYLSEYWRARLRGTESRQAYLDISAEVEAREVTKRIVSSTT
jgi:hypothetical protein